MSTLLSSTHLCPLALSTYFEESTDFRQSKSSRSDVSGCYSYFWPVYRCSWRIWRVQFITPWWKRRQYLDGAAVVPPAPIAAATAIIQSGHNKSDNDLSKKLAVQASERASRPAGRLPPTPKLESRFLCFLLSVPVRFRH